MDKIANVKYDAAGNYITTCTIMFESGMEVIGSVYSKEHPQLSQEMRTAANTDAVQQIEKSKFQFLHELDDAYISSWKKFMNEIDQRIVKELKDRAIKIRSKENRDEWMQENLRINSVNKVNQVYLYPNTDQEEMLFAYDEQATIRETKDDIYVEFGGIIDVMAPFKGKTLADSLEEKGVNVKSDNEYSKNK